MNCTECGKPGHVWWQCDHPDVVNARMERHPQLYGEQSFDENKDELLFERDSKSLWE